MNATADLLDISVPRYAGRWLRPGAVVRFFPWRPWVTALLAIEDTAWPTA